MIDATRSIYATNWRTVGFWLLRGILALAFVGAALFKLSGHPAAVQEFDQVGLGQWFRYFTAACELVGAGLLLWPSTVFFGAALMGMICVGAFFAQLFMLHGDTIHTVVLAGIFAAICWNQRNRFSSLELSATVR